MRPKSICTCHYIATWKTIGPNVQFSIYGTKNGEDDWIGIGFSKENKEMNGTDIILGYFDKNSNGVIKDYYAEGRKIKFSSLIFLCNILFYPFLWDLLHMKMCKNNSKYESMVQAIV